MTYRVEEYDDRYAGTKLTTLPRDLNDRLLSDVRLDEYQEPFHDNKYREPPQATYYGYSTVVIDNKDLHDNIEQSGECLTRFHSLSFSLPFRESAKRYIGYLSSYRMIDKWNLLFVCFEQMLHMTMQCPCRYQVSAVIRTVSSPSLHRGAALRYIINIITLPDFWICLFDWVNLHLGCETTKNIPNQNCFYENLLQNAWKFCWIRIWCQIFKLQTTGFIWQIKSWKNSWIPIKICIKGLSRRLIWDLGCRAQYGESKFLKMFGVR